MYQPILKIHKSPRKTIVFKKFYIVHIIAHFVFERRFSSMIEIRRYMTFHLIEGNFAFAQSVKH